MLVSWERRKKKYSWLCKGGKFESMVFLLWHAFCRVLYNDEEVFAIYIWQCNVIPTVLWVIHACILAGSNHDLVLLCSYSQKGEIILFNAYQNVSFFEKITRADARINIYLFVQCGNCSSGLHNKCWDQLSVLFRHFLVHGGPDGLSFAVENDNRFDPFARGQPFQGFVNFYTLAVSGMRLQVF